jgi:hypothetical protein
LHRTQSVLGSDAILSFGYAENNDSKWKTIVTRRRSSLGLFGIFGRSQDLRRLDHALRSVDVHPRLVPEAVKLTVVNLLKDHAIGDEPAPQSYRAAAELVGYCMTGAAAFANSNDDHLAHQIEGRIDASLLAGDSLDAQLILLTLHARVIQPSVVDRFHLESTSD